MEGSACSMDRDAYELLFAATDDPLSMWTAAMAESVHVRIGNRPTAVGREAALVELVQFFSGVLSIGGGYRETWPLRGAMFVETEIICRRGGQVVPCAVVLRTGTATLVL